MAGSAPWSESHTTYRKGATWWGRAFPYVTGEGEGRSTIYGDWWDEARLQRLSLWQHDARKALVRLLADDAAQHREARGQLLAARAARDRADQPPPRSADEAREIVAAVRLTPEDEAAIAAEAQRRIVARDSLRALVIQRADRLPGMRQMHRGDPATWDCDQLAAAAGGMADVLLRLAGRGFIPHPGDLVPPVAREMRDHTEPQEATA